MHLYRDHAGEVAARLDSALSAAMTAMGGAAAEAVRRQMLSGYPQPVMDTGALMADVQWQADARTLRIGNTLPYAAPVHDGTPRRPGRPYLADGLAAAGEVMAAACREALAAAMADE